MVKVGIIGCGAIAQRRHIPEYLSREDVQIIGYYDMRTEVAQEMAEKHGGKAYAELDELLKDADAVSVCVANAMHAEISIKALNAGCDVLCEKPMATTVEACEEMVAAAKKNGKKLMIGQNQRMEKAHVEARRMIEAGEIGKVLSFETKFEHGGPETWSGQKNPWFFDKSRSVFGAMADLGVHKTDLMHYLLGEPITKVSAILTTVDKKYPDGTLIGVDDNAYCIYQSESGVTGTMHVSWTQYGTENNSTVIQGSTGTLRLLADPEFDLIIERENGAKIEKKNLGEVNTNEDQIAGKIVKTGIIDGFVDAIVNNTEVPIPGEEAMKAMKVVFAAQKSSETGKTVEVEY